MMFCFVFLYYCLCISRADESVAAGASDIFGVQGLLNLLHIILLLSCLSYSSRLGVFFGYTHSMFKNHAQVIFLLFYFVGTEGGSFGGIALPSSTALLAVFLLIFFSGMVEATAKVAGKEFPTLLSLERAIPRQGVDIEHLKARDMARDLARRKNGRILTGGSSVAGVVDFPVDGSANPFTVGYIVIVFPFF
jgi:hypothetical protein